MEFIVELSGKEINELSRIFIKLEKLYKNSINSINMRSMFKIIKMLKIIKKHMEPFADIVKILSESINDYEEERMRLCYRYGKKDKNGNLEVNNNNIVIVENKKEEFNKEINKLKEKYKDKLETFNNKHKELNKLLEEKNTLKFPCLLNIEDIPTEVNVNNISEEDKLSFDEIELLMKLVKEK